MVQLGHLLRQAVLLPGFRHSGTYWQRRYRLGGNSGAGSTGGLAAFKAEVLNAFVGDRGIESVIEFGCGDGRQLALAVYPLYLGLDVAKASIAKCQAQFANDRGKSFLWYDPAMTVNLGNFLAADLAISLDVIYHLVEDDTYERYLDDLFAVARRFVVIYSSDQDARGSTRHVRHRAVRADVARRFPTFRHVETMPNRYPDESFCSFFVYQRVDARQGAA